jgi:hypothetical protein
VLRCAANQRPGIKFYLSYTHKLYLAEMPQIDPISGRPAICNKADGLRMALFSAVRDDDDAATTQRNTTGTAMPTRLPTTNAAGWTAEKAFGWTPQPSIGLFSVSRFVTLGPKKNIGQLVEWLPRLERVGSITAQELIRRKRDESQSVCAGVSHV